MDDLEQLGDKPVFNIDLVQMGELAQTGVRRAVLFMGLGLNAAAREDFNDYQLSKLPHAPGQTEMLIDFFPTDLPVERVRELKAEFAKSVISSGLRELIEHYALLLDTIHNYSLVTLQVNGKIGTIDPVKAQKEFKLTPGFSKKFKLLAERFGIEVPHAATLTGLYLARNAFTHAFGVVMPNHCSEGREVLAVTWGAFQTIAVGSDSRQEVSIISLIGKPTTEEMQVKIRQITREREYKVGARVEFSQQDLSEICAFFGMTLIPETLKAFADFLSRQCVIETPPAPTADPA